MIAQSMPIAVRPDRQGYFTHRLWPALAAAVLIAAVGCSRWDMRGKGFGDNSAGWAQKMRPPADERQFSGLDSRAREIERDLGVR